MTNERDTMGDKVVRRSADITPKEALDGLAAKYPNAKVASFGITADGLAYEAKLVSAEFPPGAKDDAPADDAPADDAPPSDDDGDSDDGGDSPFPPKKDKGEEKGGEAHAIAELTHLVKELCKAVGVPTGDEMGGDPMDPGMDPAAGGDPMAGGPPAPATPAPLPPPAKPHGGGGGGLGMPFAKVASERRSFVVWREPDSDGTLPDAKTAAAEVREQIPHTHKLAQITMQRAKIDGGQPVNVWVCAVTAA